MNRLPCKMCGAAGQLHTVTGEGIPDPANPGEYKAAFVMPSSCRYRSYPSIGSCHSLVTLEPEQAVADWNKRFGRSGLFGRILGFIQTFRGETESWTATRNES